uniref:Uncharacterized protein n=1 Tax=Heterorhabditis bacteriophora TaxID=37862 RepID=A0A1I7X612_HETBA
MFIYLELLTANLKYLLNIFVY